MFNQKKVYVIYLRINLKLQLRNNYLLDKDGQLIFDENGNPKLQESFFKRQLKKTFRK